MSTVSGSLANPQPDGAPALVPAAQVQATRSPAHKRYRHVQQRVEKAQADPAQARRWVAQARREQHLP